MDNYYTYVYLYIWSFSIMYNVIGGIAIGIAVLNVAKIFLQYMVYNEIKKEEKEKKQEIENRLASNSWATPSHHY